MHVCVIHLEFIPHPGDEEEDGKEFLSSTFSLVSLSQIGLGCKCPPRSFAHNHQKVFHQRLSYPAFVLTISDIPAVGTAFS